MKNRFLDDRALDSIHDPLVKQYFASQRKDAEAVDRAQDTSKLVDYAGIGADLMSDFADAQQKNVILRNRFQDLGRAPTVVEPKRFEADNSKAEKLAASSIERAKDQMARNKTDFNEAMKLRDFDEQRNPQSARSEQAREFIKQVAPSIAKVPGFESMTEEQLNQRLPTLMRLQQMRSREKIAEARNQRQGRMDNLREQELKLRNKERVADLERKEREVALPEAEKIERNDIVKQQVKKKTIRNQIGSYLEQFRNAASPDDQVRIGRQMLKVLNSTEGADAIGVDEAQRLGNALEFQLFNMTGPGPMFGRDLDGFERQVQATMNSIDGAIEQNQKRIDEISGGSNASGQSSRRVMSADELP